MGGWRWQSQTSSCIGTWVSAGALKPLQIQCSLLVDSPSNSPRLPMLLSVVVFFWVCLRRSVVDECNLKWIQAMRPLMPYRTSIRQRDIHSYQLNLSPFLDLNGSAASNFPLNDPLSSTCVTGAGSSAISRLGEGRSETGGGMPSDGCVLDCFNAMSREIASCTRSRSRCCLRRSSSCALCSRSALIDRLAK